MKVELLEGASAYNIFSEVRESVYKEDIYYRCTEKEIEELLLNSKGSFHSHAAIKMFVLRDGNNLVARFALIHDLRLPEYVQVSFFEAQKGLGEIFPLIKQEIIKHFPECPKVVVGLNGHLNYGAGILLNHFDRVPMYGLPYNPEYYKNYFKNLRCRKMFTFRFEMEGYINWSKNYSRNRVIEGLNIRHMNKQNFKKDIALYTQFNNLSFQKHTYWADRDAEEDIELFYPLRHWLKKENLIFAEVNDKPAGFFLWLPDFNQLLTSQRHLNLWGLMKFRFKNTIDTYRFTEIGIIPKFLKSNIGLAMIDKALPTMIEQGYKYCEGGYIFEENRASMTFVFRTIERSFGMKAEPYRQFATFEAELK